MQRLNAAAVQAAMRKDDTTGEYAISNVDARLGLRADALPMDSDAFAGFYQRSAPALRAYLTRVSGNAALADDLTQESYLRFLCATQPDGGEVNYRRYLFRIATNLLRDHWRRPRAASIEDVPESFFATHGTSALVESQAALDPAMAQMRPRDRQILWLAYAEGYSHREIAEITGLGAASIRLLLFRARRKIARLLREQMADDRRQA
ncbi:MAG TPA: sigma-70 family RNA polymerase sigma factor [Candidatus Solibacter sp.]|nr:sigma-70 family RNA polymerase sigma factor [Candidatus Solibacter sp.]